MHVRRRRRSANSGLFVWGDPLPAVGTPYTRGIEVQVLINLPEDGLGHQPRRRLQHLGRDVQAGPAAPEGGRALPAEREARQGRRRVEPLQGDRQRRRHQAGVNGKEVSGVSECNPRKGYLAWRAKAPSATSGTSRSRSCRAPTRSRRRWRRSCEGHQSLFTGLDLAGWKTEKDAWKAAGGHPADGGQGGPGVREDVRAVELVFDCKMPAKSKAEWSVAFGTNQWHSITNADIDCRGKWNRVVVTVGKDEVSYALNGRPPAKSSQGSTPGRSVQAGRGAGIDERLRPRAEGEVAMSADDAANAGS